MIHVPKGAVGNYAVTSRLPISRTESSNGVVGGPGGAAPYELALDPNRALKIRRPPFYVSDVSVESGTALVAGVGGDPFSVERSTGTLDGC